MTPFQRQALNIASFLAELGSIEFQRQFVDRNNTPEIISSDELFAGLLCDMRFEEFVEQCEREELFPPRCVELLKDAQHEIQRHRTLIRSRELIDSLLRNEEWVRSTAVFAFAATALIGGVIARAD